MKKDTVRTILVVVAVLVVLAIVGLGSAVWLFLQSFEATTADAAAATERFDEIRARFAGVEPVIAVRDREPTLARHPPAEATGPRPSTLRVVAWDPDEDRLVRLDLPFWFLRLKSGPIELSSNRSWMGGGDLGLTVEELERYGPTLVLDHAGRSGERVLVWTE